MLVTCNHQQEHDVIVMKRGGSGMWGRHMYANPNEGKVGRVPAWRHMGRNVRLEFMAKLRLSVDAMGRSDENISARLKAGMGEVEEGVGADEAMEPADDLRVLSAMHVSPRRQKLGKTDVSRSRGFNSPLCALSLLSMMGCTIISSLRIRLPSSLTASPRPFVNTFKHTLRGGIIL
jgi:hypothetical protein